MTIAFSFMTFSLQWPLNIFRPRKENQQIVRQRYVDPIEKLEATKVRFMQHLPPT